MPYELQYFDVRGLGEQIHYLFADNGIEYKYTSVGDYENFVKNFKPKMDFGQVPCVMDGDLQLVQSAAILRYLGRKHGLYGSNDGDAARIDMVFDGASDLRKLYLTMIYKNYDEGKPTFIKELPGNLKPFETLLKKNGAGDSGIAVGGKVSFLDYNLFDLLDNLQVLSPGCLDDFPTLKAYYTKFGARPAIKKFRETEAHKSRPINGNGKQ